MVVTFEQIFQNKAVLAKESSRRIEDLFNERSLKLIKFDPYYQRNYVWDIAKASYFIESIIIGTEIPPIILFKNKIGSEVIDGRQRYETILKFLRNEIVLSKSGLVTLKELDGLNIQKLKENGELIYNKLIDTHLRIIEFEVVGQYSEFILDQIKKEVFARYNTGITPIKATQINNAIYDKDEFSVKLKNKLKSDPVLTRNIQKYFLKLKLTERSDTEIEEILDYARKMMVLYKYPIISYSSNGNAKEILKALYSDHIEKSDPNEEYDIFLGKIELIINNSSPNRLVNECLFWSLSVIENEGLELDNSKFKNLCSFLNLENIKDEYFSVKDHHYSAKVKNRFGITSECLKNNFNIDVFPYLKFQEDTKENIKRVFNKTSNQSILIKEYNNVRIFRPILGNVSIFDLISRMRNKNFLVRPSYQRQEVINIKKSSKLIESIILGIPLPTIFIYKNSRNDYEVVDGQQRILSILGFMGREYINENGKIQLSKNHKFKLKNLNILTNLNGLSFDDLDIEIQQEIENFHLNIVQIDYENNPDFDPTDLFIRLNSKPFPIKEHSFEMWNSWVNYEFIENVKKLKDLNLDWLYLKKDTLRKKIDRMEIEELLTVFSVYCADPKTDLRERLEFYEKSGKILIKTTSKERITRFLQISGSTEMGLEKLSLGFELTELTINTIKQMCDSYDFNSKTSELINSLFNIGKKTINKRTLQDFYFLMYILKDTSNVNNELYLKVKSIFEFAAYDHLKTDISISSGITQLKSKIKQLKQNS